MKTWVENEGGDLTVGKTVGYGKVPVRLVVEELEEPMNAPGPISGRSEKRMYEAVKEKDR